MNLIQDRIECSMRFGTESFSNGFSLFGRWLLVVLVLVALGNLTAPVAEAASPYDQLFMRHESQAGAYEIGMARLGRVRAVRQEVRVFAETLILDHGAHNQALRDLARSRKIPLPPGMARRDKHRLDRLDGAAERDFDIAFLEEVERANGADVRAFRRQASRTADPEIRAFVVRFLEVDKRHQSVAHSMSTTLVASQTAVIRPPRTGDPMVVVPQPGGSPMPVIRSPSDIQRPTPAGN